MLPSLRYGGLVQQVPRLLPPVHATVRSVNALSRILLIRVRNILVDEVFLGHRVRGVAWN